MIPSANTEKACHKIQHTFMIKVLNKVEIIHVISFLDGAVVTESICQAGDAGSITGLGGFLEYEMKAHSSILAWKIPWTEEPFASMGS